MAKAAARRQIASEGAYTEAELQMKTVQWLSNRLNLRYPDGSRPRTKHQKKMALISWSDTRNRIVLAPVTEDYGRYKRPNKPDAESDRRLLVSAAREAGFSVRKRDRQAHIKANADAFLSSREWRHVRMEALKLWGSTCQCCGASAATGAKICVDHIKPRRLYPHLALELSNLQVLCEDCNLGKGSHDETDWRPTPEEFEAQVEKAFNEMMGLTNSW